jgi:hypothetical protein
MLRNSALKDVTVYTIFVAHSPPVIQMVFSFDPDMAMCVQNSLVNLSDHEFSS